MVELEFSDELQSVAVAEIELSKCSLSSPAVTVKYYIRMKNGSVHGPCVMGTRALGTVVTKAAAEFVNTIERAVVSHALDGSDYKIKPSGILDAGKEF